MVRPNFSPEFWQRLRVWTDYGEHETKTPHLLCGDLRGVNVYGEGSPFAATLNMELIIGGIISRVERDYKVSLIDRTFTGTSPIS